MPVDLYSIRYIDCSEWEKSIRGNYKFTAFIIPHDDPLKQVCPYEKIPLDVSLVHVADYSQYFDIHDNPRALLSIQAPSSKKEQSNHQSSHQPQSKDNSSLSFHPLDYVFSSEIRYELFLYCDDQLLLQRFISPYEWIPNSQQQGKHVDQTIGHYNQLKIHFKFVSERKASATLKRREKLKSNSEILTDSKRRKFENTSNEINNRFYQIEKITFHFSLWDY